MARIRFLISFKGISDDVIYHLATISKDWDDYVRNVLRVLYIDLCELENEMSTEEELYLWNWLVNRWNEVSHEDNTHLLSYPLDWYEDFGRYQGRFVRRNALVKIEHECIMCKEKFKTSTYVKPKFCSKSCASAFNKLHMLTKDTKIESILEKWLIEQCIDYTKQFFIRVDSLRTIVDFFIQPNICLYADGDYWHGFEKAKLKDKRQTSILSENGYVVIRLTESEILLGKRPVEILLLLEGNKQSSTNSLPIT